MKVLHIIDHIGLGGAQKIIEPLFENSSTFLVSFSKKAQENQILKKKVLSFSIFSFFRFIKKEKIQIIHAHLRCIHILVFLKFFFPHIILIYHDHGYSSQPKKIIPLFFWLFDFLIDHYIAVSAKIQKNLQSFEIPAKKISLLQNFFLPTESPLPHIDSQVVRIGFLGRLEHIKGIDILLEAFEKLPDNYHLHIGGTGKYLGELEKKYKLSKNIKLLGLVEQKNIFFQNIDILVIPSRYESFGLVGLESEYFGVPVIASRIEGISDIFSDTTTEFFESENVEDLVKTIQSLSENTERKNAMISEGKKHCMNFRFEEYQNNLLQLYSSLI